MFAAALPACGSMPLASQHGGSLQAAGLGMVSEDPGCMTVSGGKLACGQWTKHEGSLNCYDGKGAPGAAGDSEFAGYFYDSVAEATAGAINTPPDGLATSEVDCTYQGPVCIDDCTFATNEDFMANQGNCLGCQRRCCQAECAATKLTAIGCDGFDNSAGSVGSGLSPYFSFTSFERTSTSTLFESRISIG